MNLALIYADNNEMHEIKGWTFKEKRTIQHLDFLIYHKVSDFTISPNDKDTLVVLETKIGLINATLALSVLLTKFNIKAIFNYGAVGAIKGKADINEIVLPYKTYFLDALSPHNFSAIEPNKWTYYKNNLAHYKGYKTLNLGSSLSFVTNPVLDNFKDTFIYDMETAAYSFVAQKFNKKFFSVKCVSDIIGESQNDIKTINENIRTASQKALTEILEVIEIYRKTEKYA